MTPEQIAQVAHAAGFRGDALVTIVAIAMAESGGDPNAHGDRNNPQAGCGSYGLTQVNSCPGRDAGGHPRYGGSPSPLFDPLTNMKSAYAISGRGTNFRPWSTWKNGGAGGTYRNHLDVAQRAVAQLGSGDGGTLDPSTVQASVYGIPFIKDGKPVVGPVPIPQDPFRAIGDLASMLTSWDTWRRVLLVLGALVLIVVGVQLIKADLAIKTLT